MNENKKLHMEMIQGIINRMANNSFLLKGWAVTLIAGIFVLADKNAEKSYFLVAYIPIIVFWFLDAYYLRMERLYRKLYDRVRLLPEDQIDFSMSTSLPELQSEQTALCSCFFSKTELGFYLPLAVLSLIVILV